MPTSYDVQTQVGRLSGQLYSSRTECQHLQFQIRSLQAQLLYVQQDHAKLRQDYSIKAQQHARTTAELVRLREQVQRLEEMLSMDGEKPSATVSTFFQLEARDSSLQQAESELRWMVASLRLTCQEIENQYAYKWQDAQGGPLYGNARNPQLPRVAPIGPRKAHDASGGDSVEM